MAFKPLPSFSSLVAAIPVPTAGEPHANRSTQAGRSPTPEATDWKVMKGMSCTPKACDVDHVCRSLDFHVSVCVQTSAAVHAVRENYIFTTGIEVFKGLGVRHLLCKSQHSSVWVCIAHVRREMGHLRQRRQRGDCQMIQS